MPNHLMGYRRTFLELRFDNVQDLMAARRDIMPVADKNKKRMDAMDMYAEVVRCVVSFDPRPPVYALVREQSISDSSHVRLVPPAPTPTWISSTPTSTLLTMTAVARSRETRLPSRTKSPALDHSPMRATISSTSASTTSLTTSVS